MKKRYTLNTINPSKALGIINELWQQNKKDEHDNNKIQRWEHARPRIMKGGLAR